MSRTRILIASTFVTFVLSGTLANAQKSTGIKPGGTYENEIPTTAKPKTKQEVGKEAKSVGSSSDEFRIFQGYYNTLVPIELKAGQSLSIAAEVTGDGRKVGLMLLDPTGKLIAKTKPPTAVKSIELSLKEVGGKGTYKIVVWTDQVGPFKLKTQDPDAEEGDGEEDEAQLEARIARLKLETKAAEEKLEKLKTSKSKSTGKRK